MPVDATWRIQSNSALVTATSSFTASLNNPTQPGSTVLLFVGTSSSGTVTLQTSSSFDPPWFLEQSDGSKWYAYRRDDQPAGETSWTVPTIAVSNAYYWRAEEWGGLSDVGNPDATQGVVIGNSPLTGWTDWTGSASQPAATPDVADFAALAVYRVASPNTAAGWPAAHSYGAGNFSGPSSWNEVAYLVNGDGTHTADFILAIAEAYPGVTGAVAGSLILDNSGGGAATMGGFSAWCVCYQPAAAAPPTGVLTG